MTTHKHREHCSHPSLEVALHGCDVSIEKVGWHCVALTEKPSFVYTIGLTHTWKHPEIVIAGLQPRNARGVLAACARMIREDGAVFLGGQHNEIALGFPVRFQAVEYARLRITFGMARAWYQADVPFVQLVWPDPQGRFPSDPDCDRWVTDYQDIYGDLFAATYGR